MSDKTILVVDDEHSIVELVSLYLTNEGFTVEEAFDGITAMQKFRMHEPALVVLDLMLPGLDGYEVCRQIRRDHKTPVIMLTAKGDDVDTIVGLELGADDYMAKPFNPRELIARVKAVLRRTEAPASPDEADKSLLQFGNLIIDLARHEVTVAGEEIDLRAKEFDLLKVFAQNIGLVLNRDRLLNLVWGYDFLGDTRTIDVHVAHLRDKLQGSSAQIQTIRGTGYKMVLS